MNPVTTPIGRVTPSAMPANAPATITARPKKRRACVIWGDATTTTAVAIANRTAR